jgi:hypothetical protein
MVHVADEDVQAHSVASLQMVGDHVYCARHYAAFRSYVHLHNAGEFFLTLYSI